MSPFAIRSDFEAQEEKSVTAFTFCHEVMGLYAIILVFSILIFKEAFSTLLFHPHQEAL